MNNIVKFIMLVIPYVFMTVGFTIYDRVQPEIGGWPFFYWYQLMWIFIAGILTFSVYTIETREHKARGVA
jgi:hypothetical protein